MRGRVSGERERFIFGARHWVHARQQAARNPVAGRGSAEPLSRVARGTLCDGHDPTVAVVSCNYAMAERRVGIGSILRASVASQTLSND